MSHCVNGHGTAVVIPPGFGAGQAGSKPSGSHFFSIFSRLEFTSCLFWDKPSYGASSAYSVREFLPFSLKN